MVNLRYRVKGANKRARYQEMAVEDLITFDEPRARLGELDDIRSLAERELRALRNHEELICKLEANRHPAGVTSRCCAGRLGLPYG